MPLLLLLFIPNAPIVAASVSHTHCPSIALNLFIASPYRRCFPLPSRVPGAHPFFHLLRRSTRLDLDLLPLPHPRFCRQAPSCHRPYLVVASHYPHLPSKPHLSLATHRPSGLVGDFQRVRGDPRVPTRRANHVRFGRVFRQDAVGRAHRMCTVRSPSPIRTSSRRVAAVSALRRPLIRPRGQLLFFRIPHSLLADVTACRLSLTPAVHPSLSTEREVPPLPINRWDPRVISKLR
ncbi:hypothetical protein BHM03_00028332 [Ensete ventricosum]|uniref:Secreted protein n=1 Tax=Ensete ventricosum TaxID=4639 RepID=A0A445MHT3_ENSVE|nr:hypothetical protein BHM03_00028332 [Ensete ventricosum]